MENLGHFRILGKIGAGGMGEVYRARDERLQREVAIKVLPPDFADERARARLVREAQSAAALNHPNICTVFDVGEIDDQTYIAMECVEGEPLLERMAREPLPISQVVGYGVQLADALTHAHERGIVHRDLKPGNVIITPENRLKVLDFGLARRLQDSLDADATTTPNVLLTVPGTVAGTPAYMAPEQLRGGVSDGRSDIWALGVILYEMAAGARPFTGQTWPELSAAILTQAPPPLPPEIPAEFQRIVERCLARQPADRYQRAGEVRAALEAIQAGVSTSVAQQRIPTRTTSTVKRVIWLAACLAVIAAGLAAWRFWRPRERTRSFAVLPFVNTSNDPSIDYLCDGLTESLTQQLTRIGSLRVVPRSAVFNFKGRAGVTPRDAGRQLDVDSVVAGTLARSRGRLHIDVQLLDVASGQRVWSRTYDRPSGEFMSLRNEVAGAIIDDGLRLHPTSDQRRAVAHNPTNDPEAYDLYLQARYLQRRATADDYLNARELLKRAIVRDPGFAEAYVLLGGIHAMMAVDGLERPTDAWPQTTRYMRKALELDPSLPSAHALAHAQAWLFDWDWAQTEQERKTILSSPPSDLEPTMLRACAMERWALGHPDEALQLTRRMRELDRLSPDVIRLEADYLAASGRYDQAIQSYEKSLRIDPNDPNAYFGMADALFRSGRFDQAIEARRQAHAAAGDTSLGDVLAQARGESGYRAIERRWLQVQLDTLTARAATDYVSPIDFARIYSQLGDRERAFRYLDAAFEERSPGVVFLRVDHAWDNLREDPRFAAAVRRVGLP